MGDGPICNKCGLVCMVCPNTGCNEFICTCDHHECLIEKQEEELKKFLIWLIKGDIAQKGMSNSDIDNIIKEYISEQ